MATHSTGFIPQTQVSGLAWRYSHHMAEQPVHPGYLALGILTRSQQIFYERQARGFCFQVCRL